MAASFLLAPWEVKNASEMLRREGEFEVQFEGDYFPFQSEPMVASRINYPRNAIGGMWFRPQNSTEPGNFTVADRCDIEAGIQFFEPIKGSYDPKAMNWQKLLSAGKWGRVYHLDQDGLLCKQESVTKWQLFVGANGAASWQFFPEGKIPDRGGGMAPFHWHTTPQPERLARTPALQLWDELGSELWRTNENSLFARVWAQLDRKEKLDRAVGFARGSNTELKQVMTYVLQCDDLLWYGWMIMWAKFLANYSGGADDSLQGFDTWTRDATEIGSERVQIWKRVLLKHLSPHLASEALRHPCINYWLQACLASTGQFRSWKDTPSHHEILETHIQARMQLKQWARTHLSPELLALIEPFDG